MDKDNIFKKVLAGCSMQIREPSRVSVSRIRLRLEREVYLHLLQKIVLTRNAHGIFCKSALLWIWTYFFKKK